MKYRVEISQEYIKYGEYDIEAESEDEAIKKALGDWEIDQEMVEYEHSGIQDVFVYEVKDD